MNYEQMVREVYKLSYRVERILGGLEDLCRDLEDVYDAKLMLKAFRQGGRYTKAYDDACEAIKLLTYEESAREIITSARQSVGQSFRKFGDDFHMVDARKRLISNDPYSSFHRSVSNMPLIDMRRYQVKAYAEFKQAYALSLADVIPF